MIKLPVHEDLVRNGVFFKKNQLNSLREQSLYPYIPSATCTALTIVLVGFSRTRSFEIDEVWTNMAKNMKI